MPKWGNSRREVGNWLAGYDSGKRSERETGFSSIEASLILGVLGVIRIMMGLE